MISVIFYGRNDAHGYNLHRRAALSLNCIAEVLDDPDDELIFVDYNTPDELPTFIEAIADTLTERCLARLRLLRVRAAVHERRFAARTHLPALEPVARNVAARRANPANRWLLSTNTDMIFVPLDATSLSRTCRDLPDGFYGLPRFELPEWLWESLPRTDPVRATAEVRRLGPALRLDEVTTSHEWIRFDAPGDFQLILRDDLVAIDGFHEEMILGYHVDSNLSRRLLLRRGSIESLQQRVAGYHCNHNRTRTVYHGSRIANDMERFFLSVDTADIPAQRETWGLADEDVEEVPLTGGVGARSAGVLAEVMPSAPRVPSDAYDSPFALGYDSGHVLSFVADALVVAPPGATIAYVGANAILGSMLEEVTQRLGFGALRTAGFGDRAELEAVGAAADVFVVDLGRDSSEVDASYDPSGRGEELRLPPVFAQALGALDRLVELEQARRTAGEHPRAFLLVNSQAAYWDAYVLSHFECSYTTPHSRVRRAMVRSLADDERASAEAARTRAHRLVSWFARDGAAGVLEVPVDAVLTLAELPYWRGFGAGWGGPEDAGIWTQGERSQLRIAVDGAQEGAHALALELGSVCVAEDETLSAELYADDERLAARRLTSSTGRPWRIDLPGRMLGGEPVELTIVTDARHSPAELGWSSDPRRLGVAVRSLAVERVDRSLPLGTPVRFGDGLGGERLLGDGWASTEQTGAWTIEPTAELRLRLVDPPPGDLELALTGVGYVTAAHPELTVEIRAAGRRLGSDTFHHGEPERTSRVVLPAEAVAEDGTVELELELHDPARPIDVGEDPDTRLLGVHLQALTVERRSPPPPPAAQPPDEPRSNLRRRLTRSRLR